jgi:hypothetical protein
MCEQVL